MNIKIQTIKNKLFVKAAKIMNFIYFLQYITGKINKFKHIISMLGNHSFITNFNL